jgi:putative membrane protein
MKTGLFALGIALLAATPAAAQVMTPTDYVKTAGASDLYERESAKLVLETSRDARVRDFASMMIEMHTKSTQDVKAAAMHSKLKVAAPMLMPAQREMLAQLRAENGPARDAAYVVQQRAAHGQALSVQQAYAAGGTAPALRRAAAGIVPVVQDHIMMLMKM